MTPNFPWVSYTIALAAMFLVQGRPDATHVLQQPNAPASTPLDEALTAAARAGKPVLVMLVAPTLDERRCQARWFDDLLECGDSTLLEDLALVEVVYATRAQVEARHEKLQDSDAVGLLEQLGGRWTWLPLRREGVGWCEATPSSASELGESMSWRARDLRKLIRGSAIEFERRVRAATDALTKDELALCRSCIATRVRPGRELADRAAWLFRVAADKAGPEGEVWRSMARGVADDRVVFRPPHGSRWVNAFGSERRVEFLERDSDAERAAIEARATEESAHGEALRALRRLQNERSPGGCASGPCGTGATSPISHIFLDQYVRYSVMVPDDS